MMKKTPTLQSTLRHLTAGAAIVIMALTALTARADAQMVAAIVNGDPVTNFDIDQRIKLLQLSGGQKTPARQQVLEELIDERLKIQLLKRYNIEGIDKDVDNAFTNMARRMRQSAKQFAEQLERSGVKAETLKSRMKADLVWSQIIRGRYQSSFQFNDKEILARMENRKPEEAAAVGYDYTLRPILFVVPRGSPPAAFDTRRKEAEAFRSQFLTCEQGVPIARGMPYVAVRAPVVKGSADLPPALRAVLEKTEMGRLTAPEITQQGVEVYAVCGKKQSDNAPAKKETRDEMFTEQFESHSKRFLKELRGQAMIEYR